MKQTVRYETVFTSVYLVQGVSSFVPVYQKVFHVEFIISHGLAFIIDFSSLSMQAIAFPVFTISQRFNVIHVG